MTEMSQQEYQRLYYEVYHLPGQIERARAKLARLEDKARHWGMWDLLVCPEPIDNQWDLETARAYVANRECER